MSDTLLLDASVWLAALDVDDANHAASKRLAEASGKAEVALAALDLTLYEVANVAVTRWRSPDDAKRVVELVLAACPQTIEPASGELLDEAGRIAAEHGLTIYDAAYVACARRRQWKLVSGDVSDLVKPELAVSPDAAAEALAPKEGESEDAPQIKGHPRAPGDQGDGE